jgi:endo-1,3-1,4-beta-glycanase ExoK
MTDAMQRLFRGAAPLLAGLLLLPAAAMAQSASFRDTFDSLSTQRWYVSDGWSNGAHQNCTWSASQVKAANGVLRVGFAPVPKGARQYSCGEIQTRLAYGYGTYEARLKTPGGSGLNGAFFTYIGPQQGKPHDEIDFEVLLKDTSIVETTTFVNGKRAMARLAPGSSIPCPTRPTAISSTMPLRGSRTRSATTSMANWFAPSATRS